MSEYLFKDILLETKDGEWGKGESGEDLVRMKVIRGTDFETVRNFRLDDVPERFIPHHIAERKSLKPYDILLETAGGTKGQPTGRSVILKPELFKKTDLPITCASFSRFLRVNSDIANPEYIFWWLQYMYESRGIEVFHVQHTGVARFQYTQFATTTNIHLPPNDEQSEVVRTLSCLDKKVELNQRMNDTLEGIAQALFKSWFVDFDPVKAKAEGREPKGMDDATAALFPSRFTNSPRGLLPEGWTVETLERVSFLNPEIWPRNNTPAQIEYVDLANTKWGTIESTQIFSWKDAPSRAQRILRKGDTIVGTVRPGNGSYSFISSDGLTGSTGFAVLRPKEAFYREFVYLSTTSTENIARLTNFADGAAYPAVRPDVVYATPILFPGDEILLLFSQYLSPIMENVALNNKENKTLVESRDLLLPRLIFGKLRVSDLPKETTAS